MRIHARRYQIGGSFGIPRRAMFGLYELTRGLSASTSRIFRLAREFRLCELFAMTERITIASLRKELGLTLDELAEQLGISSKGYLSQIERGVIDCSVRVALRIEDFSGARIDAAGLSADVRMARASCVGGCISDTSIAVQPSSGSSSDVSPQAEAAE